MQVQAVQVVKPQPAQEPVPLKPNKTIALLVIILSICSIVLALGGMIFAAAGPGTALEYSGLKKLQHQCFQTFDTYKTAQYVSVDDGSCLANGQAKSIKDKITNIFTQALTKTTAPPLGQRVKKTMCGKSQSDVGCSFEAYKIAFALGAVLGTAAIIVGSVFAIIAFIPVLIHGITALNAKNPGGAVMSGGFGIGCSIPAILTSSICSVLILAVSSQAMGGIVQGFKDMANKNFDQTFCSTPCKDSVLAAADLGKHFEGYVTGLKVIVVLLTLVCFLECIFTCVSCCHWKAQTRSVQVVQPVVVIQPQFVAAAPVVAQPVVAAEPVVKQP